MDWAARLLGYCVGAWLVLAAGPAIVNAIFPHAWYYDLRDVSVRSTKVGKSPDVLLDRDINRDFTGTIEAVARRVVDEGRAPDTCAGKRPDVPFTAGAEYPGHTLEWFQNVPPETPDCELTAGSWTVDMTVHYRVWWLPGMPLEIKRRSNIFVISE